MPQLLWWYYDVRNFSCFEGNLPVTFVIAVPRYRIAGGGGHS